MSIIKKIFILLFLCTAFLIDGSAAGLYAPKESAGFYIKRGEIQFNAGMYDYAYESMILALKADPQAFEAANILGKIFLNRKDYHNAEIYFERSLSIEDNQPLIHNMAGELKEFLAVYNDAHKHFLKAAEQDPENLQALINLSRSLRRKGDNAGADRYFTDAYNKGITKSSPLVAEAAALPASRHKEKESLLAEAVKINPAHIEAYMALAEIRRERGDYPGSVKILEKLKTVKPDYVPAYLYLGNIYFTRKLPGNTREYFLNLALLNYTKAMELDPGKSETWFHLASLYRHIGNREKADEMEKKGLRLEK
jgi:tetratricopeptide (TPR) repeat protein